MAFLITFFSTHNLFSIIIGILGVGFLIMFHEFGHFLFCKLFNVATPSFSIGFGPRIAKKKIGETTFILSAIPLGGYVEAVSSPDKHTPLQRTLEGKAYWQKMIILLGGIGSNLLFAYLAITALYAVGMPNTPLAYPHNARPVIVNVLENSPAFKAGLQKKDIILAVNGTPLLDSVALFQNLIEPLANQSASILIERTSGQETVIIDIGEKIVGTKPTGFVGIEFETQALEPYPFLKALSKGISTVHDHCLRTIQAFYNMVVQRDTSKVGGPLMIFASTTEGAKRGYKIFLIILALISINLAVLNVLPIPPLDGSKALIYSIEAIFRRPIPERVQEYFHYICLLALLLLTFILSIRDVSHLWKTTTGNSPTTEQTSSK